MATKKLLTGILGLTFIILTLSLVSAGGVNVTSPTSGYNYTSTTITCSYPNGTSVTNPLSANSSFSTDAGTISVTGFSCTSSSCSASASASALTDGLNQNISCIIGNNTATESSHINATLVGFYTSTPSCNFEMSKTSVEFMDIVGITTNELSTIDSLGTESYNWTLYSSGDAVKDSAVSQEPSFSEIDFDEVGTFTLSLTIKDALGNSENCNESLLVKGKTTGAEKQVKRELQGEGNIGIVFIVLGLIILIGIIGVASFYLLENSKKRRRR